MKSMLTNNLGLKLLSVISAMMLWLVVVNIDDPVTYQDFSSIRVTMLNEDAVTGKDKVYRIEDNSDMISVRVWAKRSVLSELSSEDFTATADMEKNIKYDNLVGIDVSCSNRNVKSADITKSRENVVISVEDASSEQFNVVVNQEGTTPGKGYVVGTAVPEQSMIEISGPSSVIAKINRVEAKINVNGFTSDRTVHGELKLLDGMGSPVDTTYLEYYGKKEGIDVRVTFLKTKVVKLKVGYTGTPGEGYSFSSISCKPETLEIAGEPEDIGGLTELVIPDQRVNIEGITEDLQLSVDISSDLPPGIRLANAADASIAVQVELEKKQGKTIRIPVSEIELRNVPRGLKVDFGDLKEIELVVMGTSAELAQLNEDEIGAVVDLRGYSKSGTYTETIQVTLPETYSLMNEVEVEFKLAKQSTART